MSITTPKLVILGLDGLSVSLAKTLSAKGVCPNLARLLDSQKVEPISSELPELSPVNWTSFFTGQGPEQHGIFGFTNLNPRTYQLFFTDSSQICCPTLFHLLGEKGIKSRVINLPNTYPAFAINGMLVCGFPAQDLFQAVHPKFLYPQLKDLGYLLEADTVKGSKDHAFLLEELRATLISREKLLHLWWPDLAWDLFILVLTELDRVNHFLYPAWEATDHPWHEPCLNLFKAYDRVIGQVLELYQGLPQPKRLLVLADHGFTELKIEIDLNVWLRENNYLFYHGHPKHELDATGILPQTKAFALDPGRIYIHTQDRFSRGSVKNSQAKALAKDIQDQLLSLSYEGENVFAAVFNKDELYPGCTHIHCPDLVCLAKPGFELKAKFNRNTLFARFSRQGTHCAQDVFFYDSQGQKIKKVRESGQLIINYLSQPPL